MNPPNVFILGGGFSGQAAARALRPALRRRRCRLTLIDRHPLATMIPALPDVAAGLIEEEFVTESIQRLLPDGTGFLLEAVSAVDLDAGRIYTSTRDGTQHHDYDYLVLAFGSVATPPAEELPPAGFHTLSSLGDAMRIRQAFGEYLEHAGKPHAVFSGAGYTGIELAVTLARAARRACKPCRFTLLERRDTILPFLNERRRTRVQRILMHYGIDIRTRCRLAAIDGNTTTLSDGNRLDNIFVCRTEGTCAPINPAGTNIERLPDGRLVTHRDLSLPGYPNVYTAGDSAAIRNPTGFYRKAVNFAICSGARAGANIALKLQSKPTRPFHPVDLGWVIPLGNDSVGQAFGGFPLDGKPGLMLHYCMCGFRNFNRRNFVYFVKYAFNAMQKE